MEEPGWIRDPGNPGFERYHDGTTWTERTRVAAAGGRPAAGSESRGGAGGMRSATRAVFVVLGIVVLGVVAFFVWFAVSGARNLTGEAANVATGAPAQADAAAVAADAQNLRLAVETAVVDSGGHLPTVTFTGGAFAVTGADQTTETVPASASVSAGGITGATGEDYCVWVATSDGITMHTDHAGEPQVGGC